MIQVKKLFFYGRRNTYLSESDVKKTIKEIKEHSTSGSILITDFYAERLIALQGVKLPKRCFILD